MADRPDKKDKDKAPAGPTVRVYFDAKEYVTVAADDWERDAVSGMMWLTAAGVPVAALNPDRVFMIVRVP